jgi:hypothetical protein
MSSITVSDIDYNRELDRDELCAISGGGGAPWIYGWITPYVSGSQQQGFGAVVNVFDITNNITNNTTNNLTNNTSIGQMINQYQDVSVNNTGNGAMLSVNPNAVSGNRAG